MVIGKYEIIFTTIAKDELLEIYEYINDNLKSKISANRLMEEVENKIFRLSIFPYSCEEKITKPRNTIYRKLQVKNYVLLYKINEENKRVDIVHIYYSRRNYLL